MIVVTVVVCICVNETHKKLPICAKSGKLFKKNNQKKMEWVLMLNGSSDPSIPSSSYPGPPVSMYLCIPDWCRRAMGLGDAPIGDARGDYPTGIPALDEVSRHGRLLVCLLWGRPSFLRRRRPDQCPPSTYHPIALQWSSRPKELHSQQKLNG